MIGGSNMDPETVNVLRDYVQELMTCVLLTVSTVALAHANFLCTM